MIGLQLFGPIELTLENGTSVHSVLAQPKRLALLAYLATARPRGFHTREQLLAFFWPEKDDEHARAALSQSLHFLRRSLGNEAIQCRGAESVAVNHDLLSVDVLEFEELIARRDAAAALEHYRGPFFDGLHLHDALELERWVEEERERLDHLAWRAALDAAEAAAGGGDLEGAVAFAKKAVGIRPVNGLSARTLMTVLHRAGDRAGALEVFGRLNLTLREEYDAEPEQETLELVKLIRLGCDGADTVTEDSRTPRPDLFSAPPHSTPVGAPLRDTVAPKPRERRWRSVGFAVSALGFAASALALGLMLDPELQSMGDPAPLRLTIPTAGGHPIVATLRAAAIDPSPMALSRDGSMVAYALDTDSGPLLVLWKLDDFETRVLDGTTGATSPFFSPDGRWVGFATNGTLQRRSVDGGPIQTIAEAPFILGAAWTVSDSIVFTPDAPGGLEMVSAAGGEPVVLTQVDQERDEYVHAWPHLLPDGESLLFEIWGGVNERETVWMSLADRTRHTVLLDAGRPRYLATGHLVFEREGRLFIQPFDAKRGIVSGSPVPFLDTYRGFVEVSPTRMLYLPPVGGLEAGHLVRVDRRGDETPLAEFDGVVLEPQLSADARRLFFTLSRGRSADVFAYDLATGQVERQGEGYWPVPSPDGRWLAVADAIGILRQRMGGTLEGAEPLHSGGHATSWSAEGTLLIEAEGGIWALDLESGRPAHPVVQTGHWEAGARFSPGGDWFAYMSNESGRSEVYVDSYHNPGQRRMVSARGGLDPVWSTDGRELFYRWGAELWSAPISMDGGLTVGEPHLLFTQPHGWRAYPSFVYDPATDGFIMTPPDRRPRELRLLVNWADEVVRAFGSGYPGP